MARQYGWDNTKESNFDGINSRMDEIQAAILRVNLRYLDEDNKKRQNLAMQYNTQLERSSMPHPEIDNLRDHAMHLYVVECERRHTFREFLLKRGIGTGVHYAKPIHKHPSFKIKDQIKMNLPVTEKLTDTAVSLPMHPFMEKKEIDLVLSALSDWIDQYESPNKQATNG